MAIEQVAVVAAKVVAETKADKFRRLATMRVESALNKVRLIGNLGGAGYDSTKEQHDVIEKTLHAAIQDAVNNLRHVRVAKTVFKL